MKKFLQMIGLYLIFGIFFAAVITIGGAYENLVIRHALGPVTLTEYLLFMLGVIILWLPGLVFFLFSKINYFNFIVPPKIVFGVILAVFMLFSAFIIKRKKTRSPNCR